MPNYRGCWIGAPRWYLIHLLTKGGWHGLEKGSGYGYQCCICSLLVRCNRRILGRRSTAAGARYARTSERQHATIKTKSGTPIIVQLKDGAHVVAVTKGAMSDIQQNSFVGIASMPQPDGTLKAVEVSVFAEPLRGTAEGHYPWDLMPGSTMTNAAVTKQVTKQEGNTLTLKHKDGEQTIVVPADVVVVNLIPGDNADLKPGAKIFIPAWAKKADGTWEGAVALIGRDGVTPPM